jgi:hypothetical protein
LCGSKLSTNNNDRHLNFEDTTPLVKSCFAQPTNNLYGLIASKQGAQSSSSKASKQPSSVEIDLVSPCAGAGLKESKFSSLIESPMPPVTDPKTIQTEKGVKDFSRQYLKEGMWPGKINHSVIEYR